jgi:hypothetical protein
MQHKQADKNNDVLRRMIGIISPRLKAHGARHKEKKIRGDLLCAVSLAPRAPSKQVLDAGRFILDLKAIPS